MPAIQPVGYGDNPRICAIVVKPGIDGVFHAGLGLFDHGGLVPAPFPGEWPLQILNTVTFSEQTGKTVVTITSVPFEATAAEQATFESGRDSMTVGWTGTLDQLGDHLGSQS